MALDPALESELRHILATFRAAHGAAAVPGGAGKALEVWLLMKLAETARSTGNWAVTLCQGDGLPIRSGADFIARGQPGPIARRAASAPGFVELAHPNNPTLTLELHGSLQWLGRSGTRHECDVSLLPAMIGNSIRNGGGGYPSGLPIAALECKDKTSPGSSDEMRQTLARLFDLTYVSQTPFGAPSRVFHQSSATVWGRRSSRYLSFFASGVFGIVRVGAFQRGAQQLGQYYHIGCYWDVFDSKSRALSKLQSRFKEVLSSIGDL